MPRGIKAILVDLVVPTVSEPEELRRIPERCEWIRKEKGTTCYSLGICVYCKAMERMD
jgi:hypothetical protein